MTDAYEVASVAVVVPTIGRPSLDVLLDSLAVASGPAPVEVVVVDDRPAGEPLLLRSEVGDAPVRVVRSGGRGPAAARNCGWRATSAAWTAFLDDDVVVTPSWLGDLQRDLVSLPSDVAGSQGAIVVPLPPERRPTDWERSTASLATSEWITADMAYRRAVLQQVGGFDERFRRAYREDSDLAIRVMGQNYRLVKGSRCTVHPVRPADDAVSVRMQAGNADDVLMRHLHGPDWRAKAGAPRGRRRRHVAVTAAGVLSLALAALGRRPAASVAAFGWLAGTGELTARRITPGPRDRAEVQRMLWTSAAIPPMAVWHALRGAVRHRGVAPWRPAPDAVLFDRDGTLVVDVPYNGDPAAVTPAPGARESLDRLRQAGIPVGVITNQSGVGRGLLTTEQVDAVNARIEQLLGPFDVWQVCPHAPEDDCSCRKPSPGMVQQACAELGVHPARTVLVGDIGSDVEAALAAGASGILVPTPVTLPDEVDAAPRCARDLVAATDLILQGAW